MHKLHALNSFASKQNYSEEVAYEIDKEIGRIVDESYKQTKKILQDNMDRLEYVAKALLVYETLDADQFLKAIIFSLIFHPYSTLLIIIISNYILGLLKLIHSL